MARGNPLFARDPALVGRRSYRRHIDNTASQRVAEKCGFVFVYREGDEFRFRLDTMVKVESLATQCLGGR